MYEWKLQLDETIYKHLHVVHAIPFRSQMQTIVHSSQFSLPLLMIVARQNKALQVFVQLPPTGSRLLETDSLCLGPKRESWQSFSSI
jgi:hypothetical protein